MIKKLKLKFILVVMTIVTVILCFMLGILYSFTKNSIEQQNENMLRTMSVRPRQPGRPDRQDEDEAEALRLPFFTLFFDEDGNLREASGSYYDLTDEEMLLELYETVMATGRETGVISEYSLRYLKTETPIGISIAFSDTSAERTALKSMLKSIMLIGVCTFLVFLGITVLLARWVVRPVEDAFTKQKQFISDASHELKTPLTVILTNAEMLSSPDYPDNLKQQLVGNIQTMAGQMRGLVESLLSLTRVDNGTATMVMTDVNLSNLVEDAVLPFEPVFFEKNLLLSSNIEKGITVKGDGEKLRQVVDILLDNAQKYCLAGTETTITLTGRQNGCLLSVADYGEPIPEEEREKLFRRFYRADKARSMNHSYGLGLSIAESIVSLHNGKIWCESAGGVNTFFVAL